MINVGHVPARRYEDPLDEVDALNECRIEFRLWDGSLEPGRVQAQIALSAALVGYAARTAHWPPRPPLAERAGVVGPDDPGFAAHTAGVRELIDLLATTDEQKRQFAALWAAGAAPHLRART